jgi:hypothetical protein
MGIRGKVTRNILTHANQVRGWHIHADFARVLIRKARELYINDSFGMELDQTAYALYSTTTDLASLFFQGRHLMESSRFFHPRIGEIPCVTLKHTNEMASSGGDIITLQRG